jgi:glyoxylase-like metal-dependent hydrolase (beta-lactamase superfamily II)
MVGKYPVSGVISGDNLVESVETQIYNGVLGNTPVEMLFSDYKEVGGIRFPMHIVQKQGGFPTLDLRVTDVQPNGASTLTVQENQGGGGGAAPKIAARQMAPGVYDVGTGEGETSYLVEFADYSVLVEAPGNDARSEAVMAAVKQALPAKPIRYVINSHTHTDHAGGLRWFVGEGITVITQEQNKAYLERIYKNSHSLNPDHLAQTGKTPKFETVADKRVISDSMNTMEIYHIAGSYHDPALLMVYLPKQKILMEADAYNPRPPGAKPAPSPNIGNLVENIRKRELDVAQVAYIHGGIEPVSVLLAASKN